MKGQVLFKGEIITKTQNWDGAMSRITDPEELIFT
jgi:hypothetical protein